MKKQSQIIYDADLYYRLSKEDGDVVTGNKYESNSISNQKELIQQFLDSHAEIRVHAVHVDDGYSGTNFNRPGFQKLLQNVKEKKINCVIVKDLSRIGRNYLEVGEYVQEIFPDNGIRLIAINDNYDSISANSVEEDIIIPFKNLINDAYSKDLSMKIRSNLQARRRTGKYTGAYVTFGYKKNEQNHNCIEIDDYAANVVKDIFKWKLNGMNQTAIAERLNSIGIPSPMEYKRACGIRYYCSFKNQDRAMWCAQSVTRILKNKIYMGVLTQGVRSKISYRSEKMMDKDPKDWCVLPDGVTPIIDKMTFERVQVLLGCDTRTSPSEKSVYTYAGLLFCGDCGESMVRKTIPSRSGKKYIYYVCSKNKKKKTMCTSHIISEEKLNEVVLVTIQKQIRVIADMQQILKTLPETDYEKYKKRKVQERIQLNNEEIEKCKRLQLALYEDLNDNVIDKEEYFYLKEGYLARKQKAEDANRILQKELQEIYSVKVSYETWISNFVCQLNIQEVTREVAVQLLEKICIYEEGKITLHFRYQDKFEECCKYVEKMAHCIREEV